MWKKFLLIFILFLTHSNLYSNNNYLQFRDKLNDIYYSFDIALYKDYLSDLSKYKFTKDEEFQLSYYKSIALLNMGKLLYPFDRKSARSKFISASKECENAIELGIKSGLSKTNLAELYAIHCDILSKQASLETINAIPLGRKAHKSMEKAIYYDKESKIVKFIGAIQLMHLPKVFGGDKSRSRSLLNSLLKKTVSNINDSYNIRIAEPCEIYAYLAQLEVLNNNIASAEEYIKKASKLQNNYGYIEIDLRMQINNIKGKK